MSQIMINRFIHSTASYTGCYLQAVLFLLSAYPATSLISNDQPNPTSSTAAATKTPQTDILADIADKMQTTPTSPTKDHIDSIILLFIDDKTKYAWKKINALLIKRSTKLQNSSAFSNRGTDRQNCDDLECPWRNLSIQITLASAQIDTKNILDTTVYNTLKNWAQNQNNQAEFQPQKTNENIQTITQSLHTMNMDALTKNLDLDDSSNHIQACFIKYWLNRKSIGNINNILNNNSSINLKENEFLKKYYNNGKIHHSPEQALRKLEQTFINNSYFNSHYISKSFTQELKTDEVKKKERQKERSVRQWIRKKSKENKRKKRQRRGTNPRKKRRHKKSRRQET